MIKITNLQSNREREVAQIIHQVLSSLIPDYFEVKVNDHKHNIAIIKVKGDLK